MVIRFFLNEQNIFSIQLSKLANAKMPGVETQGPE